MPDPRIISIDVETYGACIRSSDGRDLPAQTVFHPRKSLHVDGVERRDLVLTCSITLVGGPPDSLHEWTPGETMVLHLDRRTHLECLLNWLDHADVLVGMNLQFDLLYLRAFSREAAFRLGGRQRIVDVGVVNYLHSELREERSLKDLGPVLGTYKYRRSLKDGHRFASPHDQEFLEYAAADTHNAVLATRELARRIGVDHPGTDKLSPWCLDFYSRTIWSVTAMSEAGIPMDSNALESIMEDLAEETEDATMRCREEFSLILDGPGSASSKESLIDRCLREAPEVLQHPMLQKTEKTRKVSFSSSNISLLLSSLPEDSPLREPLVLASRQQEAQKILSTYLWPLLRHRRTKPSDRSSVVVPWRCDHPTCASSGGSRTGGFGGRPSTSTSSCSSSGEPPCPSSIPTSTGSTARSSSTRRGSSSSTPSSSARSTPSSTSRTSPTRIPRADAAAHPTWYVVPGRLKDSGSEGGTVQARITCKDPAAQTFPPQVKECIASRWTGGSIMWADLSQIELRVAALLSGERSMIDAFAEGRDLHAERAVLLFGEGSASSPDFRVLRQVGKTVNFADLFLASPHTMQAQAHAMTGKVIDLSEFQRAETRRPVDRPWLWRWQQSLLARADRDGKIVLPLTGQSRTFVGGSLQHRNAIVNFPVQTTAANVMLCMQHEICKRLPMNAPSPRIMACCQVYDSILLDVPPGMEQKARTIVAESAAEVCRSEGYWGKMEAYTGNVVPLAYDID